MVVETLRGLSPSVVRQVVPLVEQLAPMYFDMGQVRPDLINELKCAALCLLMPSSSVLLNLATVAAAVSALSCRTQLFA